MLKRVQKRGKLSQSGTNNTTIICHLFWVKIIQWFFSIFSLTPSKKTPVSRLRPAGKLMNFRTMTDTDSGGGSQLWEYRGPTEPNLRPRKCLGSAGHPQLFCFFLADRGLVPFPLYGVFGNIFMNQSLTQLGRPPQEYSESGIKEQMHPAGKNHRFTPAREGADYKVENHEQNCDTLASGGITLGGQF